MNLLTCDDFIFKNPKIPQWVVESYKEFDENLKKKDFPCLLGIKAHKKKLTKIGYLSKSDINAGEKLALILDSYVEELNSIKEDNLAGLLPLIVFIEVEKENSLEYSHVQAWKNLTEALKFDKQDWPSDIPKDTSLPDFAYCFAGEKWFVNVSSPFHEKRKSRKLGKSIVLAMQTLSGANRFYESYEKKKSWQKIIRERTKKYDGGMEVYEGLGPLFDQGEPRPFPESYFLPDDNIKIEKFWENDVKKYKYILFDLDGTLIDSTNSSIIAIKKAFELCRLKVPTSESIINKMGIPIESSFKDLSNNSLSENDFNNLLTIFRRQYAEISLNEIKLFTGIESMLNNLKSNGSKIGIVTSKKTEVAIRELKVLNIDSLFDVIIGSDLVSQYKPKPEGLIKSFEVLNIKADEYSRIIYIGDTVNDLKMANLLNISSCAVTWGAGSMNELITEKPKYIVNNVQELSDVLESNIVKCPFKH